MRLIQYLLLCITLCSLSCIAQAVSMEDAMTSTAQALAGQITTAGLHQIGIPEFANGPGAQLGGETGAAGQYFAQQLADALTQASNGKFVIIDRSRLDQVLQEGQYTISSLTVPANAQAILAHVPGMDGIILGAMLRFNATKTVECSCRLLGYPKADVKGSFKTKIDLDTDLLSLFGVSYSRPADTPVSAPAIVDEALFPTGDQPSPPVNPHCPYAMEILAQGKPQALYQQKSALYVPATTGEVFQIRLTNRTKKYVAVALFIDGLNTIFQRREIPSKATRWVIHPESSIIVNGWQVDEKSKRTFVFTSSNESLAARRHFSEQLGLITAAYFAESGEGNRGDLGVGEGDETDNPLTHDTRAFQEVPTTELTLHYDNAEQVKRYTPVTN